MNIEMFIKFPGILITIGAVLLLLSIILGLIAYKKDKNVIGASSLSNSVLSVEEIDDEKPPIENTKKVEEVVKEEEKETFTFPKEEEIEDIKTEPIPLIKEVVKEQEVVLEEPKEIKEIKEELPKEEPIKEEKTTLIYGGVEPTKKFNFSFNSEKGTYEDNKTEEVKPVKEKEIKIEEPLIEEVKDEAEEDIEIL